MYPTTHDITPQILQESVVVIGKLLDPGNDVLLVTKPHLECIERLCREFSSQKSHIVFRFTIGALDDAMFGFWEPYAPKFAERLKCLKHAHTKGFATSVSIEPMLDAPNIVRLYEKLQPHVTQSIWIGKMNQVKARVQPKNREECDAVAQIIANQTDEKILAIYEQLREEPLVQWKESIKKVVGLPLAETPGMITISSPVAAVNIAAAPDDHQSLAAEINEAHEQCVKCFVDALDHAMRAGQLLLEAKAAIGHGGWGVWVEKHCKFSQREAERYMRLAHHRELFTGANSTRVSNLSLNAAIRLISQNGDGQQLEPEMSDAEPPQLEEAQEDPIDNEDLQRAQTVRRILRAKKRTVVEKDLLLVLQAEVPRFLGQTASLAREIAATLDQARFVDAGYDPEMRAMLLLQLASRRLRTFEGFLSTRRSAEQAV